MATSVAWLLLHCVS